MNSDFNLNEMVYDNVSKRIVKIIGIVSKHGKIGYINDTTYMEPHLSIYVDNEIDNGFRKPWELRNLDSNLESFNKPVESMLLWW